MKLDAHQLAAVGAPPGKVLVVASPGSGKTRCLTERVRRLLEDGAEPSSILCLTFTRRAAEEMKKRLTDAPGVRDAWIGTFHSVCHRILRANTKALEPRGYVPGWTIIDSADQLKVMERLVEKHDARADARYLLNTISRYRLTLRDPATSGDPDVASFATLYRDELVSMNVMDFDALLVNTLELLEEREDIRLRYASQFEHVLVDEFQDVDPCQWRILKLLTSVHGNLFAVGDPDQSIYGFRGASLEPILEFASEKGVSCHKLARNYRSCANIIRAADCVIARNSERLDKAQEPVRPPGDLVELYIAPTEEAEAIYAASAIVDLIENGVDPGEIAVLARTTFQFALIDRALTRAGVPHRVVGYAGLLGRAAVKDVVALLRFALNRYDAAAFERAASAMKKGVGPKTISAIIEAAKGRPIDEVIREGNFKATVRARAALQKLLDLADAVAALPPSEAVKAVGDGRVLKIKTEGAGVLLDFELLAHEFEEESPDPGLQEFTAFVTAVGATEQDDGDSDEETVKVMTMHASKGKEFGCVFLVGLDDGIVPHFKAETAEDIEEERRLFFVAMTRAKDRLFMSYPATRLMGGVWRSRESSRFIGEIDRRYLVIVNEVEAKTA